MRVWNWVGVAITALAVMVMFAAEPALAGQPVDKGLGFQPAATPVMESIQSFYDKLLVIITVITVFVLALLVIVMVRFNAKSNPTPSKTSHNTVLEIVWTSVPVMILIYIWLYSWPLLKLQDVLPPADMTIKVTGNAWNWTYEYPDHGEFYFDSNMVPDDQLREGQPRLLATDEPLYVPVNKTVRLLITGSDVIHAWAVPAFGVKMDAIPGRLNESWFRATKEGIYYGQCSELCGQNHAFMPIEVRVVSDAEFGRWVSQKQAEAGILPDAGDTRLAQANIQ